MKILVTGGAGYVGSHVVRSLCERGHDVLTYDNLSTGHDWAVLGGGLVRADLADAVALDRALGEFRPDVVMHFAASIEVGESVADPLKYYMNNARNTLGLLGAMARYGVRRLIFSSTAAVYGMPGVAPVTEAAPLLPINPYGESKAFVERVLRDLSATGALAYVALRYFNAAGADREARIGERHTPESHLIPLVLKAAKGEREGVRVYGADYPTPDGTCIRDFVHVDDLASAHVLACEYLLGGGASEVFNCGYGHGYSVREVIEAARAVTGLDFPVSVMDRRPGDPPVLVADSERIRRTLGWVPAHDDLEYIVRTAWRWEKKQ
jgi:UDP-glucose 4-epimerase